MSERSNQRHGDERDREWLDPEDLPTEDDLWAMREGNDTPNPEDGYTGAPREDGQTESTRSFTMRMERWLEYLFNSGVELSFLGTPGLVVLIYTPFFSIDGISFAGLTAVGFGAFWLALFRGKYVDVGEYPGYGNFSSVPVRFVVYNTALIAGTYAGAYGWDANQSLLFAILFPVVITGVLMASLPRFTRGA
ncbi:hypothetical protein [Natronocalculus amylovorans]|uniref:DUF8215 domain-containing protein n=1 Tax=Natronocalculus amylovorans TaxID=2917812 RepID=A0AAE3G0L4_9EURY|nr:hypothetical protein [Natronocalculus amylovorans]MCL9817939.1 hypothetical protein [Natronocalculus amylovorans]NUE03127.1 hypothetical protein [Halorubraceae archaeon YAN]